MKKLVLIAFVFFVSVSFSTLETDFCQGFKDGFCEGYKDVKGSYYVCPVAPVCPVPGVGQDTYRGGYNTGFKAGMKKGYNDK